MAERETLEKLPQEKEKWPPGLLQMLSPQGQAGSASLPPVSICGPVTHHLNPTF